MKKYFLYFLPALFLAVACRHDERDIQRIDQVLDIYVSKGKKDLLNAAEPDAYTSYAFNDVYGYNTSSPVNMAKLEDANGRNYLEYIAGARRVGIDSVGSTKHYESKIALAFSKKINDTLATVTNDTMVIRYLLTPELFEVRQVFYNDTLRFTKSPAARNVIEIRK